MEPWTITAGTVEDTGDGKLSPEAIRTELARFVRERREYDSAFHYLDGLELYGSSDAEQLPMPDNLHPADGCPELDRRTLRRARVRSRKQRSWSRIARSIEAMRETMPERRR